MKYLFINLLVLSCATSHLKTPITIETGSCYRNCPEYRIEIVSNDRYTYTDLKTQKSTEGQFNTDQKQSLEELVEELSELELESSYGKSQARDLQQILLKVKTKEVQIYGRQFAPNSVKKFIQWVDKLAQEHAE
ncbi:MAG: DUF6438 domain-containing protein [Flavobacteriaceae bacterium]|jgi:hypothetical protein|nr:DUF6438 domain-containing protein [Flavobacteriaceae bacterium]